MKVYVMFDPLYERVLCVHEDPDMDCENCRLGDNGGYGISEKEFEVVPGKSTIREIKINDLGI
jgi:hypothetical protein